jgi:hypothetical protein
VRDERLFVQIERLSAQVGRLNLQVQPFTVHGGWLSAQVERLSVQVGWPNLHAQPLAVRGGKLFARVQQLVVRGQTFTLQRQTLSVHKQRMVVHFFYSGARGLRRGCERQEEKLCIRWQMMRCAARKINHDLLTDKNEQINVTEKFPEPQARLFNTPALSWSSQIFW